MTAASLLPAAIEAQTPVPRLPAELARHALTGPLEGFEAVLLELNLASGALNPGESSIDAALREVQEETGYQCELVRELTPVTYWFQRGGRRIRKTVRWYLMRPIAKVGEHDHEVDEVLWADRAEAQARLRYDSDRRLLAAAP